MYVLYFMMACLDNYMPIIIATLTIQEMLQSQLPPVWVEEVVGEAVILKVFKLTGARRASVGGCRVKQGKLIRNALYRILRDEEVS